MLRPDAVCVLLVMDWAVSSISSGCLVRTSQLSDVCSFIRMLELGVTSCIIIKVLEEWLVSNMFIRVMGVLESGSVWLFWLLGL